MSAGKKGRAEKSDIESEQHNIAVLHNIVLALGAHKPGFFCRVIAAALHKSIICDNFGAYKAAFKVGMYFAGCLRRLCALCNCPCAHLLRAGGEEAYKPQKGIAGLYKAVKPGFLKPQLLKKGCCFLFIKLGKLLPYGRL